MFIISFLIVSVYFLMNVTLIVIWLKQQISTSSNKSYNNDTHEVHISIIIPVRNEAENILFLLHDLEKQTLSKALFEVIVADDDSTDETLKIVQSFQKNTSINLIINQLPPKVNNTSPKKRAIDSSIQLAKGQLIATTDGDCRVEEKWLETIVNFQSETGAYLVSGAVTFFENQAIQSKSLIQRIIHSFIEKAQIIEFGSLVGSGACAMFIQKPNMCNGANLTYLKSVFYEVGGFAGNENLASGDDEFLMHKIAAKYPEKVQFLKNSDVIVATHAHATWRSFYNQRKRWASKWRHYDNWNTTALAVFIFSANFILLLAFSSWLLAFLSVQYFVAILLIKFSAEFVFLTLIVSFLRKKYLIWFIPFVQIIYPLYVVFFGLAAQKQGEYIWKGRKLS
ncbi:glycosyltransferase [Emticicia sp. SJ17W-69]|uniref:glycosyltransferase n=1 Tax=Emticicia sp. SJ17W-69 TaxID=3421657 RepID=UPI003EB75996